MSVHQGRLARIKCRDKKGGRGGGWTPVLEAWRSIFNRLLIFLNFFFRDGDLMKILLKEMPIYIHFQKVLQMDVNLS